MYAQILEDVAVKTSMLERRAEEVERETVKLKKAEYMEMHMGQSFEGVVSGVTAWGIYVELPNTVEGLVHVSTMADDYYVFDEENYCLVGEESRRTYYLGDPVCVEVSGGGPHFQKCGFCFKQQIAGGTRWGKKRVTD